MGSLVNKAEIPMSDSYRLGLGFMCS